MSTHTVAHSDGLNHDTPTGFTWEKMQHRAYQKKLYRAIHEARTNPDYQLAHPSECRTNPESKVLSHCHPEAEKRIKRQHSITIRKATVPTVIRPPRLNRV